MLFSLTWDRKITITHISSNIFLQYFTKSLSYAPGKVQGLYHQGTEYFKTVTEEGTERQHSISLKRQI